MTILNYELFQALQKAGVPEKQAMKASEGWIGGEQIVTKTQLQAELAQLEKRLLLSMGGMIAVGVVVLGLIISY